MRHLDHIVVAVRDLDRAADMYRRLGFQVGARNRHPWGTENRLIQFSTSFIELITVGAGAEAIPSHQPRRFSFGAFVRDYLEEREGMAMLVLSSTDARADAALFTQQGIGDFEPFSFERKARTPDGSETQVAFTLAFASESTAPRAGFFVCQQLFPENFWNSTFQRHPNSAQDIAAVTLTASEPDRHTQFLNKFSGAETEPRGEIGFRLSLHRGRIEVVSNVGAHARFTPSALFTSFSVRVGRFDALTPLLTVEGIPFTSADEQIVVPSTVLFGVELRFER